MRIILPNEEPIIKYCQDYAFPAAALSSDTSFQNWIYTNAVQLYYIKDRKRFNISYFYLGYDPNPIDKIPLIKCQSIDLKILKSATCSAISFVKEMITNGYYITCLLNEYYINNKNAYQKEKFEHGNMIVGYDDKEQLVYIVGFDKERKFTTNAISFNSFEKAFYEINRESDFGCCFKRNKRNYEFDKILFKELLYDFLNSQNTSEHFRMIQAPLTNCFWGIEACWHILDDAFEYIDYRYVYTLYEYICIMERRLCFFPDSCKCKIEKYHLRYKLEKLKEGFHLLLLLAIKINMRGSTKKDIDKMHNLLGNLLHTEMTVLQELYDII